MHLAKRLSLLVCLALLGASVTACKKDEKKEEKKEEVKKDEGGKKDEAGKKDEEAKKDDGTKVEDKKEEAPSPEAAKAMKGFAIAVDKAPDQPGSGGGLGGMGSMFGSMFGGGNKQEAAPTGDVAPPPPTKDDQPPTGDMQAQPTADTGGGTTASGIPKDLKLPPPAPAGGGCPEVTERIMVLVDAIVAEQLKQLPEDQRKAAEQFMTPEWREQMKTEFNQMCETQAWSQELKDCVLTAADVESLEKCEALAPKDAAATEEPKDYAEEVAAPTAEAGAWAGGNSCDDVGKRMMELYNLSMGDQSQWPEETKKQVAQQLEEGATQLVQTCKDANFNEATRDCLVKATNLEATQGCWELMYPQNP